MSTNGDMSWRNAFIHYDGNHYYATAYWDWASPLKYAKDMGGCMGGCTRNMGGPEGVGLALNYKVTIPNIQMGKQYDISFWGDGAYFPTTHTPDYSPSDVSAFGVGFEHQDQFHQRCLASCTDLDDSMAHGDILLIFDPTGTSCRDYQAFFKYGHTWDTTSVTGISLSSASVGFTWSTTSNHWFLATNSNTYHIC